MSSTLVFDGTSGYVEVPDSLGLNVPSNLTVEAWINPSQVSARSYVLSKGGYRLAVEPSGGGVTALFGVSNLGTWRWIGSQELALGEWYHVAGTYDGATMRLFVNGVQASSGPAIGAIDVQASSLRIGTAAASGDFFSGFVDEVRVSDIVRYTTGFVLPTAPFAPDLNTRGLWHFDEGTGTSTADASPGANTGALLGGLTWTMADPAPAAAAATATPTSTPAATFNCPCTLFGSSQPANTTGSDSNAVALGVKFRSSVAGRVTGIRFYKGSGNTGNHVGKLWTSAGTQLASATFSGESASGWQQVSFATPVTIAANTTYVATYFAPVGHYPYNYNSFGTNATRGPLTALSSSSSGGNGVFRYGGASSFPNQTYQSTNYWVDVVFDPTASGGDVTPTGTTTPTPARATNTPTNTPVATNTPAPGTPTNTPTNTPVATSTPTRTNTPVVTNTPTNTPVPTNTPTNTPVTTPVSGSSTGVGGLVLKSTFQSISVYANYSGDSDANNRATLEYRRVGDTAWKRGMDMTPDRRQTVFGADANYNNPFKNQWRASVLMTQPDTQYEVRVTWSDPNGVVGTNPVVGQVRTRDESPPAGGATYHVAGNGSDSNPGTAASPWRTLGKAAGTVVAGDTVMVHAGTYSSVSISRSGTAANWIVFRAAPNEQRPVISAGAGSGTLAYITGSYVRFGQHDSGTPAYTGGFELVGGQSGVIVGGSAHDVMIEGHIVRGQKATNQEGVPIQVGETFSTQNAVQNVTVQDNDVREDTLPEPETNAILVKAASGGHVFRRNKVEFFYQGGSVHGTDCFGGLPNFAPQGGFYSDTDVSDNICIGATDEGIEIDGGNANIRIWGNSISRANGGFSITPVYYGPVYVFRNVLYSAQDHWIGSCYSVKDGEGGNGAVYFYHNTFDSPSGAACKNIVKGFAKYGGGNAESNVFVKNNIIHHWGRLHETGSKTLDYNLNFVEAGSGDKVSEWNGANYFSFSSFQSGSGQEAHGRWGVASFANAAGGDFHLAGSSPAVDGGVSLPGFNDADSAWPSRGAAPDIGAFES